ncbi:MAG: tetratricopeptide repeat protein [Kofleriaceae bacterium]
MFAIVLPFAGCGGDKPSTPVADVDPPAAVTPQPAPVVAVVPDAKLQVPAPVVEHWIPAKASECMSLGKEFAAKSEHARARELFTAAAKLDKKSAEPHVELARSYIATSERALAIRHASKAVKLAPDSSQAYNTLGRAELLRHGYDAAIIAFRQATELNADNVWAWNNLGLVYMTLKDYREAANALAEATSHKGTEGYMWNNLGLAYEQLDELDDAREAFESGAKLGSSAAIASRKRLEGVDTIVTAKVEAKKPEPEVRTYETREEMPEVSPEEPAIIEDSVTFDAAEHADEPTPVEPEPAPVPEAVAPTTL